MNQKEPLTLFPPILWRRLDQPGHESARLTASQTDWLLAGTAVFVNDRLPCRLDYLITCDSSWSTRAAQVTGWVGEKLIDIAIQVDAAQNWWLNGMQHPAVAGCIDLDLNFSPVTNMLPIRRLNLPVGQFAPVQAAWLRFPEFTFEPLPQVYYHTGPSSYRYESSGGTFTASLTVNADGFIIEYPPVWVQEA